MKVNEIFKLALEHISDYKEQGEKINEVLDMALESIKLKIIRTESIDKTIELKKLHKDIETLKYKTWKLERIFDEEIDKLY